MNSTLFFIAAAAFAFYWYYRAYQRAAQQQVIDEVLFPGAIKCKILEVYPHLTETDADWVLEQLREYFHLCRAAGHRRVAMPSQAVDVAWHEFLLCTKQYDTFCDAAFGRFLLHAPAKAMKIPQLAQRGIQRTWNLACQRGQINPKKPLMLPDLFAIDAELNIPDGFRYVLGCGGHPVASSSQTTGIYSTLHNKYGNVCASRGGEDSACEGE